MCIIHVWVDFTPKIWHLLLLSLQINKKNAYTYTHIVQWIFFKVNKENILTVGQLFPFIIKSSNCSFWKMKTKHPRFNMINILVLKCYVYIQVRNPYMINSNINTPFKNHCSFLKCFCKNLLNFHTFRTA